MAEKSKIIAFGSGSENATRDEMLLSNEVVDENPAEVEWIEEETSEPRRLPAWSPAWLAIAAAAAWTVFFAWARGISGWASLEPAQWTGLVTDWTVPVLLVGVAWLLFMRNSRREAIRFGEAARVLADESERLEARLTVINRELSLAREFIGSQSHDLEALGRIASERLSHNADRLQDLIRENGERLDTIGTVSEAALTNMEKLRGQLPVIASSAKDVTNNIGNAGRSAHNQLEELIAGFKRLNEFGQASERQVLAVRNTADAAISEFARQCEQLDEIARSRFAALAERGAEFRAQLDSHEVEALAAIRGRASALSEELERTRQMLDGHEEESLTSLRARLMALRDEGGAVSRALRDGETRALDGWRDSLAAFGEELRDTLAALEEAQSQAVATAGSRLATLVAEAEAVEAGIAERRTRFDEELRRRRSALLAENQAAEAALAGSGARFDEEVQRRRAALLAEADALEAKIGESGSRLDEELQRRRDALLAEVEAIGARIGESGVQFDEELERRRAAAVASERNALAELSRRFAVLSQQAEAVEARMGERGARFDEELERRRAAAEAAEGEALDALSARFETLARQIAAIEERIGQSGRQFDEQLENRRAAADAGERDALAMLSQRLAALDAEIGERRAAHERQTQAIAAHGDAITARLAEFEEHAAAISGFGAQAEANLGRAIEAFAGKLGEARMVLTASEEQTAALTDATVRLLELIRESARHSHEDLPKALAVSEERLAAIDGRIALLGETVGSTNDRADGIARLVRDAVGELTARFGEIEALQASLGERSTAHGETLAGLREALGEIERQSEELADKARGELSTAIDQLSTAAREATGVIGTEGATAVSALARQFHEESFTAIDKAMRNTAAETAGQLEAAAAHAAGVSREAAILLRDQLAKVNELVGNLERRVAHARQRAEENVDNDFSRRVALITESLNSNAIDIAKALSSDVSETAWAAYLRGDRGIFTRRAVNLLESGEAKTVAQIYERDREFNEHVSRYIHDFEAMLREVLSTRDGQALAVTLLSSDMGKLYVALAQSIERLRS